MFEVVISSSFTARQGLKAPVRDEQHLPVAAPAEGFHVVIRAGIVFESSQLNERGWYVDTDAVELKLKEWADHLASDVWTSLFDFRPTFERVAETSYQALKSEIPQLQYIELDNTTLGVRTQYIAE